MILAAGPVHAGWNLWSDLREMLSYHFMVNALLAGTVSAVLGGVVGWFMVVRRQSFAGHTLSVVAFPGAAGAAWLGVSTLWGYFGLCAVAALIIAAGSGRAGSSRLSSESALVGVVQAFALAGGFLFVSLYGGFLNETQSLLFGTFLGVSNGQLVALLVFAVVVVACLLVAGRRLLFASVDPAIASSQGISDGRLNVVFLVALGFTVAEVSQVTGALLVFALLVMPASAAQRWTARPGPGIALGVVLAVIVVWAGLAISFYSPYPTGFWITTVGFAVYAASGIRIRADHPFNPVPAGALT